MTSNSWAQKEASTPSWFAEIAVFGGSQSGKLEQNNWSQNYMNALNSSLNSVDQKNGFHYGLNASLGYFFGKKKFVGLGAGFQFLQTQYDLTLNPFSIEYQSIDGQGYTFRQGILSNAKIDEQIKQHTFGIPLMVLFKKEFGESWGVHIDAGVILNVTSKATFEASNSNFDYEAVYKLDNNGTAVFDDNATPDPNSWLITQEHYNRTNPSGDVNEYFDNLHNQGFNVGLGITPTTKSGSVTKSSVNTTWFVRPSVSYKLNPNVALHFYINLQQQKTNFENQVNYKITEERGDYSSMTNGLKSNKQLLYSAGIGVRYAFGKKKTVVPPPPPVVKAPIVEKKPEPVVVKEPINEPVIEPVKPEIKEDPYKEMVNVTVKLLDEQYGKPVEGNIRVLQGTKTVFSGKTNSTGISNLYLEPGNYSVEVNAIGYLITKDELQLVASEKGKPKTVALKPFKIEKGQLFQLSNISFETSSNKITPESIATIDKMVEILKENPTVVVEVGGHTDNSGDSKKNLELSKKRAIQVMNYMISKGVNAKQMKAVGYGETKPISDNETPEGKALNRRVVFTVLDY